MRPFIVNQQNLQPISPSQRLSPEVRSDALTKLAYTQQCCPSALASGERPSLCPPTQNGIYQGVNFSTRPWTLFQHNPAGCVGCAATHINNQPLYQLVFPFSTHPARSSLRPSFTAGLPRIPTRVTPLNSQQALA